MKAESPQPKEIVGITQHIIPEPQLITSESSTSKSQSTPSPNNKHVAVPDNPIDRKFNVVVYGIKENPTGTPRSARTKSDIDCCVHILKEANNDITEQSIRDCFRLGKFDSTRTKPRPLLVKLSRAFDVNTILYNRSKIPEGTQVKPDMSKEEKLREQLLLKERWSLISSGTDKKHIKIRGTKIYVKNQIHGELVDSTFVPKSRSEASNTSNSNSTMEVVTPTSQ